MKQSLFQNTQRILAENYRNIKENIARKGGLKIFWGYIVFLFLLSLTALFLMVLVQVRLDSFDLGYRVAKLQKEKEQLLEEIHVLQYETTRLSSPSRLLEWNQTMELNLLPPEEWMEEKL